MKVVGIKAISYVSKKTEKHVEGVKIYYTIPIKNTEGVGFETDVVFCKPDVCQGVNLGDEIEILFNKYGSVAAIRHIN